MGTSIRPELAKSNKYWIEKHRYYELKHFCMQYPTWTRVLSSIDGLSKRPDLWIFNSDVGDPTARAAIAREYYSDLVKMIQDCAEEADPVIGQHILRAVITGMSYDTMKARIDIPCCKDVYYDLYRKFFWILNCTRK